MSSQDVRWFDVIIMSDFQLPGGTSASITEEIKAQASAGYTTGLIHVPTGHRQRPFHLGIRRCIEEGLADLIVVDRPVHARLFMARHPLVVQKLDQAPPRLDADVKMLVVNQVPLDALTGEAFYDIEAVLTNLDRFFGEGVAWVPIGPIARQSLVSFSSIRTIAEEDWINVIDLDEWTVDRSSFVADVPVIGRHSRPNYKKWPDNASDLLNAYPDDDRHPVRILGGSKAPEQVLGYRPQSWTVIPFNGLAPREFLAQIDFYVYFHHPSLVEAFGRGVLEALASGAVTIVPHQYETLFGDACIYARPADVRAIVDDLYRDKGAYDAQAANGIAFARRGFSHDVHARRVAGLIGPPSGKPRAYRRIGPASEHRVLFVADGGSDPGSLERLMAMARHIKPRRQPVFFALSANVSSIHDKGWPGEWLDIRHDPETRARPTTEVLLDRLRTIVRAHRPSAVVFGGTMLPGGLGAARREHPAIPFVWCRPDSEASETSAEVAPDANEVFDLVLESGRDGAQDAMSRIEKLLAPRFG